MARITVAKSITRPTQLAVMMVANTGTPSDAVFSISVSSYVLVKSVLVVGGLGVKAGATVFYENTCQHVSFSPCIIII